MTESKNADDLKKCPFCAEMIKVKAHLCKFCKSEISTDISSPASLPLNSASPVPQQVALSSSPDTNFSKPNAPTSLILILVVVGVLGALSFGAILYFAAPNLLNKSAPTPTKDQTLESSSTKAGLDSGQDQTQTPANEEATNEAGVDTSMLINKMLEAARTEDESSISSLQARLVASVAIEGGDTESAERLNKLGLAALKSKKYRDAAILFKSASQSDPSDPKYFSNLGFAELNAGDFISAEEHLYKSLSIAPERAVAWDDLGLVLAKKQDPERAVAAFLLGFRASTDKSPVYLQSLKQDHDPDVQLAGSNALNKLLATGQISKALLGADLSPTELVKELFTVHNTQSLFSADESINKRIFPKFFNDHLAGLLLKSAAAGQIDADPIYDTQSETKITNFEVTETSNDQGRATVVVTFKNFGKPNKKIIELLQTEKGWRISNITDNDGSDWCKSFGP